MIRPRVRLRLHAAAIAAVLLPALLVVFAPPAIGPTPGGNVTFAATHVGERFTMLLGHFGPHAKVHVLSARMTGVPDGIRVVEIQAFDSGPAGAFLNGGPDSEDIPPDRVHPVRDMVFRPGALREEWNLLVVVEVVKPGRWRTSGVDLTWRAGWRRGTTHYAWPFGVNLDA